MIKSIIIIGSVLFLSACADDKFVRSSDGGLYRVVEKCDVVPNPNYGHTKTSSLLLGAGLGAVVGKKISKNSNVGTLTGATLGAIIASEPKNIYTNCRKVYRKVNSK